MLYMNVHKYTQKRTPTRTHLHTTTYWILCNCPTLLIGPQTLRHVHCNMFPVTLPLTWWIYIAFSFLVWKFLFVDPDDSPTHICKHDHIIGRHCMETICPGCVPGLHPICMRVVPTVMYTQRARTPPMCQIRGLTRRGPASAQADAPTLTPCRSPVVQCE